MESAAVENAFENDFAQFEVDERISYPSYKSLDEFVDTERLRALDGYLTERIKRHIATQKEDFFLNLYRLEKDTPYQPGVREIWLTTVKPDAPPDALDLVDETDLWQPSAFAEDFALLMDFIETLPFEKTGRMLVIYDDAGRKVPAHRDHLEPDVCSEFVWFRTNFKKSLYFLNPETGAKKQVEGYTAWFDAVNQYHGSDAITDGLAFSIRVDGVFTDEFRKLIPQPEFNRASTPSFWASLETEARTK